MKSRTRRYAKRVAAFLLMLITVFANYPNYVMAEPASPDDYEHFESTEEYPTVIEVAACYYDRGEGAFPITIGSASGENIIDGGDRIKARVSGDSVTLSWNEENSPSQICIEDEPWDIRDIEEGVTSITIEIDSERDFYYIEAKYGSDYDNFFGDEANPIVVEVVAPNYDRGPEDAFPISVGSAAGDNVIDDWDKIKARVSGESVTLSWTEENSPIQIRVEQEPVWDEFDIEEGITSITIDFENGRDFYCIEAVYEGGNQGGGNNHSIVVDFLNDLSALPEDDTAQLCLDIVGRQSDNGIINLDRDASRWEFGKGSANQYIFDLSVPDNATALGFRLSTDGKTVTEAHYAIGVDTYDLSETDIADLTSDGYFNIQVADGTHWIESIVFSVVVEEGNQPGGGGGDESFSEDTTISSDTTYMDVTVNSGTLTIDNCKLRIDHKLDVKAGANVVGTSATSVLEIAGNYAASEGLDLYNTSGDLLTSGDNKRFENNGDSPVDFEWNTANSRWEADYTPSGDPGQGGGGGDDYDVTYSENTTISEDITKGDITVENNVTLTIDNCQVSVNHKLNVKSGAAVVGTSAESVLAIAGKGFSEGIVLYRTNGDVLSIGTSFANDLDDPIVFKWNTTSNRWETEQNPYTGGGAPWYTISYGNSANLSTENGQVYAIRVHIGDITYSSIPSEYNASETDKIYSMQDTIFHQRTSEEEQDALEIYGIGGSDGDIFFRSDVSGASIDFMFIPDFGYQLKNIYTNETNGMLDDFVAAETISSFTFNVVQGKNVHFNVKFVEASNTVNGNADISSQATITSSDAASSGALEMTVDTGTPNSNIPQGSEALAAYDITLKNVVSKGEGRGNWETALTDLGSGSATITLPVDDTTNYTYSVIREHDGSSETLEVSVTADGISFVTNKFSTYTIVKTPVAKYTVSVASDGNGTVSADKTSVAAGETVTLSATPATGYHFVNWESNEVTVTNNTFTMPASDVNVKAIFEEGEPTVYSVTVTNDGNGTASSDLTNDITSGTIVTITATASEGYQFKNWQVISGDISLNDASSSSTTFTMGTSNVEIEACFEESGNSTPPTPPTPEEPYVPSNETLKMNNELSGKIASAAQTGVSTVIYYDAFTGNDCLCNDTLQLLADNPNVTLVLDYTFFDVETNREIHVHVVINQAILSKIYSPDIKYYGPACLSGFVQYYNELPAEIRNQNY